MSAARVPSIARQASPNSSRSCVRRNARWCHVRKALRLFSAACWQRNSALAVWPEPIRTWAETRSSSALASHSRDSLARASLGVIEQPSLAHDGGRQGCPDPGRPLLEIGFAPRNDVLGESGSTDRSTPRTGTQFLLGRIVRDHHQEIQIAIRPVIAARDRSEQVDANRLVEIDQLIRDLRNRFVACHVESPYFKTTPPPAPAKTAL